MNVKCEAISTPRLGDDGGGTGRLRTGIETRRYIAERIREGSADRADDVSYQCQRVSILTIE